MIRYFNLSYKAEELHQGQSYRWKKPQLFEEDRTCLVIFLTLQCSCFAFCIQDSLVFVLITPGHGVALSEFDAL